MVHQGPGHLRRPGCQGAAHGTPKDVVLVDQVRSALRGSARGSVDVRRRWMARGLAPIAFRQNLCDGCSDVSDEVLFIYKVNGLGLDKNDRLHTCLHTCEERT